MDQQKVWKYHLGEWTEIADPIAWTKGDTLETGLLRAGYYNFPTATYGDADLLEKKDETPPYRIHFSLSSRIEMVIIDDMPSLMQWLRDYAPFFLLDFIAETLEEMRGKIT